MSAANWLAERLRGEPLDGIDAWERWVWGSVVLGCQFWLMTAILTVFDLLDPPWWRRLVLSSTRVVPKVTLHRVLGMMPVVLRNTIVSSAYVWLLWNLWLAAGPHRSTSYIALVEFVDHLSLDWFGTTVVGWMVLALPQLFLLHVLSQLWFWSAHRFVHSHETLYKFIHAAHHVHSEPFALTAIDCSVSEMLLLNIPAVVFPLLVLQPYLSVQCVWMVLAASHVPLTHSGHLVAGGAAADAYHSIHHRECRFNFGSAFLDKLAGTYKPH
jgi:sterol desaturase/sphingolipid hydroxylase (fatty acid hydroxylase superfamily)